jgi:hypothetical protein
MQDLMKAKMIPGEWEPRRQAVVAPPQEAPRRLETRVTPAAAVRPLDVWHRPGLPLWLKVSIFGAVLAAAMFLAS